MLSVLKIIGLTFILSIFVYPIAIFFQTLPQDGEAAAIGAFVTQIFVVLAMLPVSAILLYARERSKKK